MLEQDACEELRGAGPLEVQGVRRSSRDNRLCVWAGIYLVVIDSSCYSIGYV